MTAVEHNRFLAIGFGIFALIFGLTFLLLMLVSIGVFVGLGISMTKETHDSSQMGVGILGGVFAVIFYLSLGLIFSVPPAVASWKMWKQRRHARGWGIIAAILVLPIAPLGTMLAIYGLWFLFSEDGRRLYSSFGVTPPE